MAHFNYMQARGSLRGYIPETTNNILVVTLGNVPRAEEFFHGMIVNIITGSQYDGFF